MRYHPVNGYREKNTDSTLNIIIIIVTFMVVIIIFIGTLVSKNRIVGNRNIMSNLAMCPPNECAVNIITGTKRCSTESVGIVYNITEEVCSQVDACPNEIPFAIGDDGETFSSFCNNSQCMCSKKRQAPRHSVSTFFVGNTIQIIPNDERLGYGNFSQTLETKQHYKINPSYLSQLGCDFTYGELQPTNCKELGICQPFVSDPSVDYKSMALCMNTNLCPAGILSYNTKQPTSFGQNVNDPGYYTVSCNLGIGCNPQQTDPIQSRFFPDFDYCAYNPSNVNCNIINSTGLTLYYPVWNEQTYTTECVRLYPALYCYCILSKGGIQSIVVEYSGPDFSGYILNNKRYYSNGAPLNLILTSNDNGIGASAYISEIINNRITSITVSSSGSNYNIPPSITVSSPSGFIN
jgi:hypothetical protein